MKHSTKLITYNPNLTPEQNEEIEYAIRTPAKKILDDNEKFFRNLGRKLGKFTKEMEKPLDEIKKDPIVNYSLEPVMWAKY